MRFRSYAAAMLAAAAIFCMTPAARADFLYVNGSATPGGNLTIAPTTDGFSATTSGGKYDGLNISVTASTNTGIPILTGTITGKASATVTFEYEATVPSGSLIATSLSAQKVFSGSITGGSVTAYSIANNVTTDQTLSLTSLNPNGVTSATVYSGPTTTVDLYVVISSDYKTTGTVSVTAGSLISAPEPTGVLIGLLGLPCMGAVVYFARRRSSEMAALVA